MGWKIPPKDMMQVWVEKGMVDPSDLSGLVSSDGVVSPPGPGLRGAKRPSSSRSRSSAEMVLPLYQMVGDRHVWVLPVVTASEVNGRQWRDRSNRTKAAFEVVSRCMTVNWSAYGPIADHWRAGGVVGARFVRLGGVLLDAANLGGALKATEDGVCRIMGTNDRPPRWLSQFEQEPQVAGEPRRAMGVRVELWVM